MSGTSRRRVIQLRDGVVTEHGDSVAVEEPVEIIVDGVMASTTMRTPGHDVELALGWLVSEGVVRHADDVVQAKECYEKAPEEVVDELGVRRLVEVTTRVPGVLRPRLHPTSSACGVCGGDVIAMTLRNRAKVSGTPDSNVDSALINGGFLLTLPHLMRDAQRHFDSSGGMHAAALFTRTGDLICLREDVGRHNAVDKVIGWALTQHLLPLHDHVLQVSGRASAELVHKAVMAGVPVLSAISAPTTLAVDLARAADLTLAGFVRNSGFTLYSGAHRVNLNDS
jgi:FdhD protein